MERFNEHISDLKSELLALHQSLVDDEEHGMRLEEENTKRRAHAHLATARINLEKLEDIEAERNITMKEQLQRIERKISKKMTTYKSMITDLKEENRQLMKTLQLLRTQPAPPQRERPRIKKFIWRLGRSAIFLMPNEWLSAAA